MKKNDEYFMRIALDEARLAYEKNETPIGAVIVYEGNVISKAHNLRHTLNVSTNHAEVLAINKACKTLNSWRLEGCTIYVTIEPCVMCSGAIIQSRIARLVYGAREPKGGTHQSVLNLFDQGFTHKVEVTSGVLDKDSAKLMSDFFKEIREKRKSNNCTI